MLVETYEAIETLADGQVECEAEALELIEKLGLTGQQKMLSPEVPQRCPYRKMTKDEAFVYGQILTGKSKLKDYDDGPIPLRVLQVAAHANGLEVFDELTVWYAENADLKDPILIGIKKEGYTEMRYLLARWGEVLEPWSVLVEKASEVWRGQCKAKCAEIIGKVKARLDTIDTLTAPQIVADHSIPSFYG